MQRSFDFAEELPDEFLYSMNDALNSLAKLQQASEQREAAGLAAEDFATLAASLEGVQASFPAISLMFETMNEHLEPVIRTLRNLANWAMAGLKQQDLTPAQRAKMESLTKLPEFMVEAWRREKRIAKAANSTFLNVSNSELKFARLEGPRFPKQLCILIESILPILLQMRQSAQFLGYDQDMQTYVGMNYSPQLIATIKANIDPLNMVHRAMVKNPAAFTEIINRIVLREIVKIKQSGETLTPKQQSFYNSIIDLPGWLFGERRAIDPTQDRLLSAEEVSRLVSGSDLATDCGLSDRDLALLPNSTVTNEQVKRGMKCTVCMEGFNEVGERVADLRCGHFYHTICIRPWLRNNDACPECRETVNLADVSNWTKEEEEKNEKSLSRISKSDSASEVNSLIPTESETEHEKDEFPHEPSVPKSDSLSDFEEEIEDHKVYSKQDDGWYDKLHGPRKQNPHCNCNIL